MRYCHCEGPDTWPRQDLPQPPFAAVQIIRVSMLKVIPHTHSRPNWDLLSLKALTGKWCIFLSAYIPRFEEFLTLFDPTEEHVSKALECCLSGNVFSDYSLSLKLLSGSICYRLIGTVRKGRGVTCDQSSGVNGGFHLV